MGCGASSSQSTENINAASREVLSAGQEVLDAGQELVEEVRKDTPSAVQRIEQALEVAGDVRHGSQVVSSAAGAAVAAAGAGATVQIIADHAQDVGQASSEVVSVAGEALLALGKELPWIGPVAFLIGAVVNSAHQAHTLKADAITFARCVESVDSLLQEAAVEGALHGKGAQVIAEDLRAALEEGLAYCQKLQCRSIAMTIVMAARDAVKFEEVQAELQRCLGLLTAASAVATHTIVREKYDQSQQLKDKVNSLGGVDKVLSDPELCKTCQSMMEESDALILSAVTSVNDEVKAMRHSIEDTLHEKFAASSRERELQHDVMSRQIENLTGMMQTLLRAKAGFTDLVGDDDVDVGSAPKGAGGAAGVVEEVRKMEEAFVAQEVHNAMEMVPLPANEAARLAAVEKFQLEAKDCGDVMEEGLLNDLVQEALQEFGVDCAYIGTMERDQQVVLAGQTRHLDPDQSQESTIDITGGFWPKEVSNCQHTMVSEGRFDIVRQDGKVDQAATSRYVPSMDMDVNSIFGAWMGDTSTAARIGPVLSSWQEIQTQGEVVLPNGWKMQKSAHEAILGTLGAKDVSFSSVPIVIDGHKVATFCTANRNGDGSTGRIPTEKLDAVAARAAELLKKRANKRGDDAGEGTAAQGESTSSDGQFPRDAQQQGSQIHRRALGSELQQRSTQSKHETQSSQDSQHGADVASSNQQVSHTNAASFQQVVLYSSAHVAVLLHTPWCQHCKSMKAQWEAFACSVTADPPGIVFAAFDVDEEDPPHHHPAWAVNRVPSVVLVCKTPPQSSANSGHDASASHRFLKYTAGPCTAGNAEGILRWIKEACGSAVAPASASSSRLIDTQQSAVVPHAPQGTEDGSRGGLRARSREDAMQQMLELLDRMHADQVSMLITGASTVGRTHPQEFVDLCNRVFAKQAEVRESLPQMLAAAACLEPAVVAPAPAGPGSVSAVSLPADLLAPLSQQLREKLLRSKMAGSARCFDALMQIGSMPTVPLEEPVLAAQDGFFATFERLLWGHDLGASQLLLLIDHPHSALKI